MKIVAALVLLALLALPLLQAVESTQAPPLPATPSGLIYAPLGDGRVLLTGFSSFTPQTGHQALKLAIAYNPVTNTYDQLADTLFTTSAVDFADVDQTGNVLLHRAVSGKCERYLRASNQWQELTYAIADGMAGANPMAGATDGQGKTVAVSQYGDIWKVLIGADISWTAMAARPVNLARPALCWGSDGLLYAFNGRYTNSGYQSAVCHRYNPASNTWSSLPDSLNAREAATALPFGTNRFLVVGGGNRSEIFSVSENSWRAVDSLTSFVSVSPLVTVTGPLASRLPNNRILGNVAFIEPGWTTSAPLPVSGPTLHPVYAGYGKLVWCGDRPITWDLKPTITPSPVSAPHDTAVLINVAAWTHAFDLAVLYEVVDPPQSGRVDVIASMLQYTPAAGYSGADSFRIRAKDPTFGIGNTVAISVSITNLAPSIAPSLTWYQPQGAAWSGTLAASDADNDVLTWRTASVSPGLTLTFPNPTSGVYQASLEPLDVGTKNALVVVSDSTGASATCAITVDIAPINTPPSFTPGPPVVAFLGQQEIVIPGWATDISPGRSNAWEQAQSTNFSVSCANPAVFLAAPMIRSNGDLVFTPSPTTFGPSTMSITIMDSGGTANGGVDRTTIAGIPIDIRYRNQAPRGIIQGPVDAWGPRRVELAGWLSGIQAGPANPQEAIQRVTVSCVTGNPELFAEPPSISEMGALSFLPLDGPSATTAVTLVLHDDGGTADGGVDTLVLGPITLNLVSINHKPTITAIDSLRVTERGDLQSIDLGLSCSPGPAWESGQAITLLQVVSNDHPELFTIQPHLVGNTLVFQPAHNLGRETVITLGICARDSGGTDHGGVDTSDAHLLRMTMTPMEDTLLVQSNQDSGPGSLRACLEAARNGDIIRFDPMVFSLEQAYAATVINLTSSLPAITCGGLTIDARDRRVLLNGAAAGSSDGLVIASNGNTVAGLAIVGCSRSGILVTGADNQIGLGQASGAGGNPSVLRLSNNGSYGLRISGASAMGNRVRGCWIGTGADGAHPEPNLAGIILEDGASGNVIGGSGDGDGNLVSGNTFEGITCVGCSDNLIAGNTIGLGIDGRACGNGASGIFISRGASRIRIGSLPQGDDSGLSTNRIACNGRSGLEVRSIAASGNQSLSNTYWGNLVSGIALFDSANASISPPRITSVVAATAPQPSSSLTPVQVPMVQVSGEASLESGLVELFASQAGQGARLLSRMQVANGRWTAMVPVPAEGALTATFTDSSGNTSEFSAPTQAQGSESGGQPAAGANASVVTVPGAPVMINAGGGNGCGVGGLGACLMACLVAMTTCRCRRARR